MGQFEVFEYLKNKRLSGCDDFFSADRIRKDISASRDSVNNSLFKLRIFGYLELQIVKEKKTRAFYPITLYRLKQDYL